MDFNLLAAGEDGQGDEETMHLDSEAANPSYEGDEATMHEDIDNDEDPNV